MYTEEAKYSGENDSFTFKLTVFHDICARASVPHEAKARAFPTMLKGLALDFYYSNISIAGTSMTFDEICYGIREYFEGAEYKRGILSKWNGTNLKTILARVENESKSMEECLHLLIKELSHLQHGLDPEFRTDKFFHNKLINACQDVPACQFACFKPSDTLAGLIDNLRSSIITFHKANPTETFFTDRRYHKNPGNPQSNRFQPRTSFNRNLKNRKKKCFVCDKEGCWSSKHTKDEQEESKQRYKERFKERSGRYFDKRATHYITDYEGVEEDSENDMEEEMEALMIDVPSPTLPSIGAESENFMTSCGSIEHAEVMTTDLTDRSFCHSLGINFDNTAIDMDLDPFAYIVTEDRYTSKEFYGIMIDCGASKISTGGYGQYLAYKADHNISMDTSKAGAVHVKFGIGSIFSLRSITLDTPIGQVEFHIVKADTPFLLSIDDMDRLGIYFNNIKNVIVMKDGSEVKSVVRRFGHAFMLWNTSLRSYIMQSLDSNPCYLTDTELRQLHRRFGHPSAMKLQLLLERSGHGNDLDKAVLDKLTKYCSFCQKHGKSPGRFKFTLREDVNFNYSIFVDIMYIDSSLILHVVDEATRFQAARWLRNVSAKHTWDTLRLCWIDVYLGPPDYVRHDAGKNFVSKEFRQFASSMAITTKSVPVEAHWSIGIVERYHAVLRRAYKIIIDELYGTGINKEIALQIAVKAVNDTAGPDGLVPTLLVFGAYPRMHAFDSPAPSITQRATAIRKAMDEIRKIRAEKQVNDALNTRNGPLVDLLHDLPLNSDVLVWREGNAGHTGTWTGPFKLLGIEGETCKVDLPSGPTEFRSTTVKPYYHVKNDNDNIPMERSGYDDNQNVPTDQLSNTPPATAQDDSLQETPRNRPVRTRQPPTRYQNVADVSIFLQDDSATTPSFTESRRKEISGLLEKGVFEIVAISEVPKDARICGSRFVDEVKNIGTATAFEKSRLVAQAYNDDGKDMVLTQAPTIQRMSQRLILTLCVITGYNLFLRDIAQAYVQSTTSLNREFYLRPPKELGLQEGFVLKVIKPLYGVPEAGAHWYNTYHTHHTEKLSMGLSTYDSCLLFTNSDSTGFGVVGLQIDDTLILADDVFAMAEEEELTKAKLLAKDREKLTATTPIKFNGGYIRREAETILLSQEKQCKNLRLVTLKTPIDLVSSRGQIRMAVTPKDQYVAQRARGAYIATVSQPEAAFDLSFAAQVVNPNEDDTKALNKRLQWQIDHSDRGLYFTQLDITTLKLIVFTDSSFANNQDLSSQIGYVIVLADATNKANTIHWSSTKCKRVTRSVLASELYALAHGFDTGAVIKSTVEKILKLPVLPMIVCTDSKSLYECLVRLGTTQEKRLMVDLMCLRQSYERREIMEVKWIDGDSNPADAMTKAKPCQALKDLIDTNTITLKATGWVERMDGTKQ